MASTIFTGSSRYSQDFQAVITRSVAIASLPMTLVKQQRLATSDQTSALKAIDSKIATLQGNLSSLGNSLGFNSYKAVNSNTSLVRTSTSDGVREGIYSLEVVSLGSYSTSMSKPGSAITNPTQKSLSEAATFTLEVWDNDNPGETKEFNITPSSANNLNSLADAINASGAGIQASVVNIGPNNSSPDYRLSLQSKSLGNKKIQLSAEGEDFLDELSLGTDVKYKLNGSAEISSESRMLNFAQGLQVDLLKESAGEIATITVSRNSDSFKLAIENFLNSYNDVVSAVDAQRGNKEAALAGQGILGTITQTLQRMMGSTGDAPTSSITSLAQIGVEFDKEGKLSLNTSVYTNATTGKIGELSKFMGALGTNGSGFLKAATQSLHSLGHSTSGSVKNAIKILDAQLVSQDQRIAEAQARIDILTETLQDKMAKADALIATMEQQAGSLNGLFEAMKINQESYR